MKSFISFPDQRKYFGSKMIALETTILYLTFKGFPLMPILNRKSINSERNRLTVISLFLECMAQTRTDCRANLGELP